MEDADDDLLGGGDSTFQAGGAPIDKEEMSGFESSFPALDSGNEVHSTFLVFELDNIMKV